MQSVFGITGLYHSNEPLWEVKERSEIFNLYSPFFQAKTQAPFLCYLQSENLKWLAQSAMTESAGHHILHWFHYLWGGLTDVRRCLEKSYIGFLGRSNCPYSYLYQQLRPQPLLETFRMSFVGRSHTAQMCQNTALWQHDAVLAVQGVLGPMERKRTLRR